jgi:hypothetical protein
MTSRAILRDAFLPALRTVFWTWLAVLSAAAQAATGLAEIKGPYGHELVAVYYPTDSEGPPVQRWQLSLPVVEQAPPARGNGRLVVISHGSRSTGKSRSLSRSAVPPSGCRRSARSLMLPGS